MASRRVQSVNETPSQLLEDGTQNDDQEIAIQASNFSQLSLTEKIGAECPSLEAEDESRCPVCLLKMLHPVKLPCEHVFCYLCVKGVAITSSPRCALCRHPIPSQFLLTPNLVQLKTVENEVNQCESAPLKRDLVEEQEDSVQWFYEGRNGWWQYDRRTAQEIENSFRNGDELCKFMVAGLMFTIDFEKKLQYRSNDPSKRRNVRRGNTSIQIKGIAGIKISQLEGEVELGREDSVENPTCDVPPTLDGSEERSVMSTIMQHHLDNITYEEEETVDLADLTPLRNNFFRSPDSNHSSNSRGAQNRYLGNVSIHCDCSFGCSGNNPLPVSSGEVQPSLQTPSSSSDPSCFIIPSDTSVRHTTTQRSSAGSSTDQRTTSVPSSACPPSAVPRSTTECPSSDRSVYYDCNDQSG